MCLFHRHQLDPKTRRILVAGNLCISSSLILMTHFAESSGHRHPVVYDGLRFLLIGCAITLLYWSARRMRNCAPRP
jgi:hypothetical protein